MRRQISSGSPFEARFGYSRAIAQGDWCFVSGSTGFDPTTGTLPTDVGDQARAAFRTIEAALTEAGFSLTDVVRVQYTVTDRAHFPALEPVVSTAFGDARPAATMVFADLLDPDMKVEIEVTAFRG